MNDNVPGSGAGRGLTAGDGRGRNFVSCDGRDEALPVSIRTQARVGETIPQIGRLGLKKPSPLVRVSSEEGSSSSQRTPVCSVGNSEDDIDGLAHLVSFSSSTFVFSWRHAVVFSSLYQGCYVNMTARFYQMENLVRKEFMVAYVFPFNLLY